jgi:hypothetical protein
MDWNDSFVNILSDNSVSLLNSKDNKTYEFSLRPTARVTGGWRDEIRPQNGQCQSSGVSTPRILGNSAPVIYGNDAPRLGRMRTNFGRYQMSLS